VAGAFCFAGTGAHCPVPPFLPPLTARDDLVRREREFEAELQRARQEGEKAARLTSGGDGLLCATPFGVDIVGITEAVALVGALVGGVSARQRKDELEEVNGKLRQINLNLRQQARSGTVYAPGLNYAPPVELEQRSVRIQDDLSLSESAVSAPSDEAASAAAAAAAAAQAQPLDVETEIRQCLRDGRNKLKESSSKAAREAVSSAGGGGTVASAANNTAMVLFKKALLLSKQHKNPILERRARRGLAVARRQHGDRKGALNDLLAVLEISERIGEHTGDTDALGAIADLYTEQGDLEKAGAYYDQYITALKSEGSGNVD
jgi:tetratricopeptide (TPR) repeat protein